MLANTASDSLSAEQRLIQELLLPSRPLGMLQSTITAFMKETASLAGYFNVDRETLPTIELKLTPHDQEPGKVNIRLVHYIPDWPDLILKESKTVTHSATLSAEHLNSSNIELHLSCATGSVVNKRGVVSSFLYRKVTKLEAHWEIIDPPVRLNSIRRVPNDLIRKLKCLRDWTLKGKDAYGRPVFKAEKATAAPLPQ